MTSDEHPPRPRRRPASKRARAAARRRDRALAATRPGGATGSPGASDRADALRPRLHRRRVRRRRARTLVALVATTVAGAGLTFVGLSLVRESTAGRPVDDPPESHEPGFEAFVVPTPTLLVLHQADQGDLAGVVLLTLHPEDAGGAAVIVPPSLPVPFFDGSELTVRGAYAGGGPEVVGRAIGDLLDIVVEDVVVLDDPGWRSLVEPVAPVTVELDEPVDRWPAGAVPLAASDVGPFLAAQAPGEAELQRLERHGRLWEAWLPRVRAGGEAAVPGELDVGLGRFVRGLAQDPGVVLLPVAPVGSSDAAGFRLDEVAASELVARAVPFPLSPGPDSRLRVRLLNGTADADLTALASRRLVEAGAAVVITGNAVSFDVDETSFTVSSRRDARGAEQLAEAFGVGAVRSSGAEDVAAPFEDPSDEIDVTIVLGRDAQDLIRRLEGADR